MTGALRIAPALTAEHRPTGRCLVLYNAEEHTAYAAAGIQRDRDKQTDRQREKERRNDWKGGRDEG